MTNHVSIKEFAEAVGVCTMTVRCWVAKKHVRSQRVGKRGHIWIPKTEVERMCGRIICKPITQEELDRYLRKLKDDLKNSPR